MSTFIRTRIRCAVSPGKVGENFTVVQTGGTPKFYKGTGIEFELAFFDGDQLFDVTNIASITISIKPTGNPSAAAEMLKTVSLINTGLDLDSWKNGIDQHALVVFSAAETAIAAGTHDITISGATSDDALDADVFGTSKIEVIDAGITNLTAAPLSGSPGVDLATLNAILGNYLKALNVPGRTVTFFSKDSAWKRIIGVAAGGKRVDDVEPNV